jgi:hypothetical protein
VITSSQEPLFDQSSTTFQLFLTNFQPVLTTFKPVSNCLWSILTNFWPVLLIFDQFWPLLTSFRPKFDHFVIILTNFKSFLSSTIYYLSTYFQSFLTQLPSSFRLLWPLCHHSWLVLTNLLSFVELPSNQVHRFWFFPSFTGFLILSKFSRHRCSSTNFFSWSSQTMLHHSRISFKPLGSSKFQRPYFFILYLILRFLKPCSICFTFFWVRRDMFRFYGT